MNVEPEPLHDYNARDRCTQPAVGQLLGLLQTERIAGAMTFDGIARGKTIELKEPLPYREGQPLRVQVEPAVDPAGKYSPASILQAMRAAPHLSAEDVDALEDAINSGQLPVEDWTKPAY